LSLGCVASVYLGDNREEPVRADAVEEFTAYVRARAPGMRRTAFLLCGDWQRAEDEVQTALVKLYLSWDRVRARQSLDGYVRTTLVRGLIDERRRPWRREHSRAVVPDRVVAESMAIEDRLTVRAALAQIPPRQRAVLVLRYYDDCDVAETARVIGCSEGTVKSQTARGLTRLRELLAAGQLDTADCSEM
jgi:RNA polymerase sigma-70 factor (sigma-E family)